MYHRDGQVKVFLVAQLGAGVENIIKFQVKRVGEDVSGNQFGNMVKVKLSASPQLHNPTNSSLHVCFKQY
jgi:hypothetical protein